MDSLVKAAQDILLVLLEVTTVLHLQQVQVQFGVSCAKEALGGAHLTLTAGV